MNTQKILSDIKAHLDQQFPDITVELYPDDADKYRLNHAKGAVLIGYQGSTFTESEDITFVNQARTLSPHFTVLSRSQWGDSGALDILDRLRQALAGYVPINGKKIKLVREHFISGLGGIWCYLLVTEFDTYSIQSLEVKII
ncbi:MAG: Gp37 family protein [Wohlfahrtiimonas sp.]